MQHLSFVAAPETVALIDHLRGELAASDDADVFRKSLALLKAAMDAGKGSDGVVVLSGAPGSDGVCIDLRN